jgi:hypothetical protein
MFRQYLFCAFALACCSCCFADSIKLKNGSVIRCVVTGYEKSKFLVLIEGQPQEIKAATVASVTIGSNQPFEREASGELLSLSQLEVGQNGFLQATLKVESADGDRFIGSTKSSAVVIQGVDAASIATGKWVRLAQRLQVVGTEDISNGATVFVLQPAQPDQRDVGRAENPALSTPRPGGVNVRDIRN